MRADLSSKILKKKIGIFFGKTLGIKDYKVGKCIGVLGEKNYNLCPSLENLARKKKTKARQ
jgi:hypothetical protein